MRETMLSLSPSLSLFCVWACWVWAKCLHSCASHFHKSFHACTQLINIILQNWGIIIHYVTRTTFHICLQQLSLHSSLTKGRFIFPGGNDTELYDPRHWLLASWTLFQATQPVIWWTPLLDNHATIPAIPSICFTRILIFFETSMFPS